MTVELGKLLGLKHSVKTAGWWAQGTKGSLVAWGQGYINWVPGTRAEGSFTTSKRAPGSGEVEDVLDGVHLASTEATLLWSH